MPFVLLVIIERQSCLGLQSKGIRDIEEDSISGLVGGDPATDAGLFAALPVVKADLICRANLNNPADPVFILAV